MSSHAERFADMCDLHRTYISVSEEIIAYAAQYSKMQADLLNGFVEWMLMDAEAAEKEFQKGETIHKDGSSEKATGRHGSFVSPCRFLYSIFTPPCRRFSPTVRRSIM